MFLRFMPRTRARSTGQESRRRTVRLCLLPGGVFTFSLVFRVIFCDLLRFTLEKKVNILSNKRNGANVNSVYRELMHWK